MSLSLDYYQILGLSPKADSSAIRRAWKSIAQKLHPDKGGSEDRFREAKLAYETLIDPQRRAVYDCGVRQGFDHFEFEMKIQALSERAIVTSLSAFEQLYNGWIEPGPKFLFESFQTFFKEFIKEKRNDLETLTRLEKRLAKQFSKLKPESKDTLFYQKLEAKVTYVQSEKHTRLLEVAVCEYCLENGKSVLFNPLQEEEERQRLLRNFT